VTAGADPFAALGLPRAQRLDLADAERRFRERMRAVHPDRAAPGDRLAAAAAAAEAAAAWRVLRDPLDRAQALLRLAGVDAAPDLDDPFLSARFAEREALEGARSAGDGAAIAAIAAAARSGLDGALAALERLLVPDAAPGSLRDAARALAEARFHASLARDAGGDGAAR
jgi:molecular chaperone HscB